ncbi:MAG: IS4 family transposase [Verrucomicrobiota bacterium]|nr:IS4 family transposase [Verrucomicrobiota bacterium]
MNDTALPEDWKILRQWLPDDLDARARKTGFMERARGLQDAERWLRLILMHVAGGLSLQQTAVRARELGLARVTSVALFKRLRKAERWLADLTQYLLADHQRLFRVRPQKATGYQLRIIDATDIQELGDTGTSLRVHYSLRLPQLSCNHYELTDDHGGEKLGRFKFQPGELILADRGYSHRAGVASVLQAGAQVLLRWNPATFPVEGPQGEPWELLAQLRKLRMRETGHWRVSFIFGNQRYPLRLCARRKSRTKAERARKKALRKAARNQSGTPDSQSLELTAYVLVLTSVAQAELSATQVLELYRLRWQIELAFKRLKSLLAFGHVPKSSDQSAKSWMQAKILTSRLIERVALCGRFFSPWGYDGRTEPGVAGVH